MVYDWDTPAVPPSFRGVVDETLRDGLQAPDAPGLTTEERQELLGLMASVGISDAVIGMIGLDDRRNRELAGLVSACARLDRPLRPWVLSRLRAEDLAALRTVRDAAGFDLGMNVFLPLSDLRLYVEGWDVDGRLSELGRCLSFGRKHFDKIRVAVEDATRTRPGVLQRASQLVSDAGVNRFTLADTAGVATPTGVRQLFDHLADRCGCLSTAGVATEWHGHDDRGLAIANTLQAVESGANFVHGTMLGVGERNGNAALEVVLLNLSHSLGERFDWEALVRYRRACQRVLGRVISPTFPFFGKNTFLSSSGTHCAAVHKANAMGRGDLARYLYSPPSWASDRQPPQVVISPISGRHTVRAFLEGLGIGCSATVEDQLLGLARRLNRALSMSEVLEVVSGRHDG